MTEANNQQFSPTKILLVEDSPSQALRFKSRLEQELNSQLIDSQTNLERKLSQNTINHTK